MFQEHTHNSSCQKQRPHSQFQGQVIKSFLTQNSQLSIDQTIQFDCRSDLIQCESSIQYINKNFDKVFQQKENNLQINSFILEQSSGDTLESRGMPFGEKQMCRFHNKQLQIICLDDKQRICPHCALFGSHKDHSFKTVRQATKQMKEIKNNFQQFKCRRKQIDQKLTSKQLQQDIAKKINDQKQRLINDVKNKFNKITENIKLAQKKAFQDIVKNFTSICQKIKDLLKEDNEANKKYKYWENKCQQLFQQAQKAKNIQEKAWMYFGGPLQICSQGEQLLNHVQFKVNHNITAIQTLIKKIKVKENTAIANSLFNYVNVVMNEDNQVQGMGHIPQEILAPKTIKTQQSIFLLPVQFSSEQRLPSRRKSRDLQSSSNRSRILSPVMTRKSSQVLLQSRKSQIKCQPSEQRKTIQKLIQQFCIRDRLDTLDLSDYGLTDGQIYQILKYVKTVKNIKGLKLTKNKLTSQGLSKIIQFMQSVTNLNLSFNLLNDDSLNMILSNRPKIPLLRIVNLSNNKINERRAKATIDQLKRQGLIVTL